MRPRRSKRRLTEIAATASKMLDAMKFDFCSIPRANWLSIGYPRD